MGNVVSNVVLFIANSVKNVVLFATGNFRKFKTGIIGQRNSAPLFLFDAVGFGSHLNLKYPNNDDQIY